MKKQFKLRIVFPDSISFGERRTITENCNQELDALSSAIHLSPQFLTKGGYLPIHFVSSISESNEFTSKQKIILTDSRSLSRELLISLYFRLKKSKNPKVLFAIYKFKKLLRAYYGPLGEESNYPSYEERFVTAIFDYISNNQFTPDQEESKTLFNGVYNFLVSCGDLDQILNPSVHQSQKAA